MRTRDRVDEAERTDRSSVHDERHPGIEANVRRAHDQGMVAKGRIQQRIADDQGRAFNDGMGTESQVARGLTIGQALLSHKPLPGAVDQGHQRDGDGQTAGGKADDALEFGIDRSVEQTAVLENAAAIAFVERYRNFEYGCRYRMHRNYFAA